jgi:hypothetical protein
MTQQPSIVLLRGGLRVGALQTFEALGESIDLVLCDLQIPENLDHLKLGLPD